MDALPIELSIQSGGLFIDKLLKASEVLRAVMGDNPRIIPVTSMEEETYPCINFRREDINTTGVKGEEPPMEGTWEVTCWSRDYLESLYMVEAVKMALHGKRARLDCGLTMRYCALISSTETGYENGVYAQEMIFMIRIN